MLHNQVLRLVLGELLILPIYIWKQMNHHYIRTERTPICNMQYEIMLTHQILLKKLHSRQNMLDLYGKAFLISKDGFRKLQTRYKGYQHVYTN